MSTMLIVFAWQVQKAGFVTNYGICHVNNYVVIIENVRHGRRIKKQQLPASGIRTSMTYRNVDNAHCICMAGAGEVCSQSQMNSSDAYSHNFSSAYKCLNAYNFLESRYDMGEELKKQQLPASGIRTSMTYRNVDNAHCICMAGAGFATNYGICHVNNYVVIIENVRHGRRIKKQQLPASVIRTNMAYQNVDNAHCICMAGADEVCSQSQMNSAAKAGFVTNYGICHVNNYVVIIENVRHGRRIKKQQLPASVIRTNMAYQNVDNAHCICMAGAGEVCSQSQMNSAAV
ncbi:hypothetical protein FQR65_LT14913 [Abscondita terminalis]|nr:hypothetical protein FQR65_LT14913 [Abscondita terminalis]